ncbi:MAG: tetratricopeptide repeat protein [Methanoregula sp.]|nr:tetratricopeptide repeat protein [Methanoregula sp.]
MKHTHILLLCLLFWFIIPAATCDVLTATFSAGPGTTETPPQSASVYISEAKAAVAERNWTSALLIATRGTTWYPDNAELLSLQGYSYRKMGQYEKSVEIVSKSILLDPNPVRHANRGYGYIALGNYPAALTDAETGIALNINYTTNYGVKALALQRMGRNTGALTAIDTALTLEPENAHYWHVKSVLLASSGNCADAREALERSIALDPDYNLPYPDFYSARENLAALNSTCIPAARQNAASPSPTKSSTGGIPVIGIIGAMLIVVTRK